MTESVYRFESGPFAPQEDFGPWGQLLEYPELRAAPFGRVSEFSRQLDLMTFLLDRIVYHVLCSSYMANPIRQIYTTASTHVQSEGLP
jgi:hypothetical protein